ncbi:MAG: class I SAM-dependent methyltransferase [Chloroflexota bacterium]
MESIFRRRSQDAHGALDAWARTEAKSGRSDYVSAHRVRYGELIQLLDWLPLPNAARVLELGCGDGFFGAFLQQRYDWKIHGMDCVVADVELSRARGIPTEHGDLDRDPIPFADGAFDVVLFDSVLEHLYQPFRALDEINRVTSPGGVLILGTPNATSLVLRLRALWGENSFARFNRFNALERGAFMRECAVFYTPAEVEQLLGTTFAIQCVRWTDLFDPFRARRAYWRNCLTPFRVAVCRAFPRLSDFFYLVAQKSAG